MFAAAMPELPPHASPLPKASSPRPIPIHSFSHLDLNDHRQTHDHSQNDRRHPATSSTRSDDQNHERYDFDDDGVDPPPSMISPAFTPPSTPGTTTPLPHHLRPAKSVPVDTSTQNTPPPKLVEQLPEVNCVVRARIPTTTGQEMFLHLYTNNADNKEHLAIVFGPYIRSKSLDRPRPGETEMDRMIRGAYTGRLYPGRTSSKLQATAAQNAGTGSATVAQKAISKAQERGARRGIEQSQPTTPSAIEQEDPIATDSSISARPTPSSRTASYDTTPDVSSIPPLVRIHSECYTGETVWSARCDCGEQLDEAARLMSLATSTPNPGGVIIYLRQEGRGIGLSEKLKAYNLQDLGNDTVEANLLLRHPADARSYGLATAMLMDLDLGGDRGIRLLTNNPEKVRAVEGPGREVRVRERVAMVPVSWKTGGKEGFRSEEVDAYLRTKVSL